MWEVTSTIRPPATSVRPQFRMLVTAEGKMVPLRPQSGEVLRLLFGNEGNVISKQDIIDAVWSGQAVSEDSVYQCVSEIRRALGQDGAFGLRTVSRRGHVLEMRGVAPRLSPRDRSRFAMPDRSGPLSLATESDLRGPPRDAACRF